jgi:hypothetical protein
MAKPEGLSKAQEVFIAEYLKSNNASAAYRIAFPLSRKWKDCSVHVRASKLLASAKVQLRVADLRSQISEKVGKSAVIEQSHVLTSAERALHADLRKLFTVDEKGVRHFVQPEEWSDELAMAIDSIKIREVSRIGDDDSPVVILTEVIEIKLSPRAIARDQLARHTGFYERDNEQKNYFANLPRETLRLLEAILSELESEPGAVEGQNPTATPRTAPGLTH